MIDIKKVISEKAGEENEEIKVWGEVPKFDFTPKDHYEVEKIAQDFHFDKAAKISKSRFVLTTNRTIKCEVQHLVKFTSI